jgi:hypothetical protein
MKHKDIREKLLHIIEILNSRNLYFLDDNTIIHYIDSYTYLLDIYSKGDYVIELEYYLLLYDSIKHLIKYNFKYKSILHIDFAGSVLGYEDKSFISFFKLLNQKFLYYILYYTGIPYYEEVNVIIGHKDKYEELVKIKIKDIDKFNFKIV